MEWVSLGTFLEGPCSRMMKKLQMSGFECEKRFNPNNCTTGCSTTFELMVNVTDKQKLLQVLDEDFRSRLPTEANLETVTDSVFDAKKESATCPACSHIFSTKLVECPECGLVIG